MNDARRYGPYHRSGRRARMKWRRREKQQGLVASLTDADSLEARGEMVTRRAVRDARLSMLAMFASLSGAVLLVIAAFSLKDGSYEGAVGAHWAILFAVVLLGALNFAWGWYGRSRELRQTGSRLQARAEYQRKLAALELRKDKP